MRRLVSLCSILALLGGACSPVDGESAKGLETPEPEPDPDPDPDPDPEPDPEPDPDPDPTPATDLNIKITPGAPGIYDAGDTIELEAIVSNVGDLDAEATELWVYLGGSSRPDSGDVPIGTLDLPALDAGGEATLRIVVDLPSDLSPGGHTIWLLADGPRDLTQRSTANDWATFDLVVSFASAARTCAENPTSLVHFPDPELHAFVQEHARRQTGSDELSCGNLAGLGQLNVQRKTFSSLEGMQYLSGLFRLTFANSTFPHSERHKLGALHALQELRFEDATWLTSLDFVEELRALEGLELEGTGVTSLAPLRRLEGLTSVSLHRSPITSTAPLGDLPALTYAWFNSNQITSLQEIANSRSLTVLLIDDNPLGSASGLERMHRLVRLQIRNSGLGSIPDLSALTGLVEVNLAVNEITDIEGLRGLDLSRLVLSDNLISNLDPIGEMGSLTRLQAPENRIADISVFAGMSDLNYIDLSKNLIKKLDPLNNPSLFSGTEPWLVIEHNCLGVGNILHADNSVPVRNLEGWGVNLRYVPYLEPEDCR